MVNFSSKKFRRQINIQSNEIIIRIYKIIRDKIFALLMNFWK